MQAGVRALNRNLAAISRHTAVNIVANADSHAAEGMVHQEASHSTVPEPPEVPEHEQEAGFQANSVPSPLGDEPSSGHSSWRQSLFESFRSLRGYPSSQPNAAGSPGSRSRSDQEHLQRQHLQQDASWQPQVASSPAPLLGGLLGGRRRQQTSGAAASQLSKKQQQMLWTDRQTARRLADGDPADSELEQAEEGQQEQPADLARAEALRQREWLLQSATLLTVVDEELVETVLGPPKYTDSDAEERIVSPGKPLHAFITFQSANKCMPRHGASKLVKQMPYIVCCFCAARATTFSQSH